MMLAEMPKPRLLILVWDRGQGIGGRQSDGLLKGAIDGIGGRGAFDVQIGRRGSAHVLDSEFSAAAAVVGQQQSIAVRIDRGRNLDAGGVDALDDVLEAELLGVVREVDDDGFAGGIGNAELSGANASAAVVVLELGVFGDPLTLKVGPR